MRAGVLEAAGEHVLVTDADLSTPIEEVEKLLAAGAPVAIGSRGRRHDAREGAAVALPRREREALQRPRPGPRRLGHPRHAVRLQALPAGRRARGLLPRHRRPLRLRRRGAPPRAPARLPDRRGSGPLVQLPRHARRSRRRARGLRRRSSGSGGASRGRCARGRPARRPEASPRRHRHRAASVPSPRVSRYDLRPAPEVQHEAESRCRPLGLRRLRRRRDPRVGPDAPRPRPGRRRGGLPRARRRAEARREPPDGAARRGRDPERPRRGGADRARKGARTSPASTRRRSTPSSSPAASARPRTSATSRSPGPTAPSTPRSPASSAPSTRPASRSARSASPPSILAKLLGDEKPKLTIGTDPGTAAAIEKMGGRHVSCGGGRTVVDEETAPRHDPRLHARQPDLGGRGRHREARRASSSGWSGGWR